jgi:autotransporter-associated beta strand protein
VTLGGSNTFSGGIQIQNGSTLGITNTAAFGTGSAMLFSASGGTNQTGVLNMRLSSSGTVSKNIILTGGSGNSATINSQGAGAATFNGSMLFNTQMGSSGLFGSTGNITLKLGGTSTADNTYAGQIINSGGGGITSLTKQDAGKWILTGANTYTGATTVSAGTLLINGSLASGSAVTVSSGAVLGGSGTIGGSVTVNSGGIVAAGNSPGILSTGDFSLAGTLSSEVGKAPARSGFQPLAGTDYDQVNVTGSVTLTGSDLTLSILTGIEAGDIYYIIANDNSDAVTGIFATLGGVVTDLSQGALFSVGGQSFQISYTGNSGGGTFTGGNDVALMAVPEPSVMALFAIGTGFLLYRSRPRRRG